MDISNLNLSPDQIAFPGLGIDGITVKSEAFTVFGITIAWYGLIIAVGMILAIVFGLSQMKKFGISPDRATDVIISGIIGGIVGARSYYVLMNWDYYSQDLKTIFQTRNGGLAIYGGIIGALLVGAVACRIRKVKILPIFDVASMGFLIGQGIGRWGNFFNHEAFGSNTDLPWGMTSGRIQQWITENGSMDLTPDRAVHPCFLYESIWCLLGFGVLFFISKRRKFDGQIFLTYVLWYGTGRAFFEGLRTDSLMLGNIRISQLLAIMSALAALILLFVISSKVKRMGEDYVFYKDTEESKALIAADEASLSAPKEKKEKKSREEKRAEKEADAEYTPIASEEETAEETSEEN